MITRMEARRNIEAWYYRARSDEHAHGRTWYRQAHLFCQQLADSSGYTLDQVVGVLAVLSPQCPWDENRRAAEALISRGDTGMTICYAANIDKAKSILRGSHVSAVCKGNKVLAFYHNIRYPYQSRKVTIDTHTARVAFDIFRLTQQHINFVFKPHGNNMLQRAYQDVASEQGTLPNIVQATTWLAMRRTLLTRADVNQLDLYVK